MDDQFPGWQEEGPSISVVVAVYDGAGTLRRCLDSFFAQHYSNKEIVVIDGGSTDGTVEMLAAYGDRLDDWVSEPDRGLYHAWNKALDRVRGDWVCFLGADDFFWQPDSLGAMADVLRGAYPSFRVVYGAVQLVHADGRPIEQVGRPWARVRRRFRSMMALPHQGVFHHRSLFEVHGAFDEHYRIAGDYELLLRELKSAAACFVPDVVVAGMQVGGISARPELALQRRREYRRAQAANGVGGLRAGWHLSMARTHVRMALERIGGRRTGNAVADVFRMLRGKGRLWSEAGGSASQDAEGARPGPNTARDPQ